LEDEMGKPFDPHRLLLVTFLTMALPCAAARFGAWSYALSSDPWLTPRWTHYMNIWWGLGGLLLATNSLLVVIGLMFVWSIPEFRRREVMWLALGCLVASIVIPGIPG
jgi:hypothetical protein